MKLLKLTALHFLLALPFSTMAATIVWNGDDTVIIGVNNVLTDDGYYDASFGSFYGQSASNHTFYPTATAAMLNEALFDSLVEIGTGFSYNKFNGCTGSFTQCFIATLDGTKSFSGYWQGYRVALSSSEGLLNAGYGDVAWNYPNIDSYVSWTAVEVAAVPLPATVWLFGSGLIGLMGMAKRDRT